MWPQNKWSIKLLPTLLRLLNNSWILSSRMLHSWQLCVCVMVIAIWDVSGGETVSKKKNQGKKKSRLRLPLAAALSVLLL